MIDYWNTKEAHYGDAKGVVGKKMLETLGMRYKRKGSIFGTRVHD
jgi:hypothetical protein